MVNTYIGGIIVICCFLKKSGNISICVKSKNVGFTLVEIVAVITLLMLLASLALPKYNDVVDKQRLKMDASTATQLASIAETWYLENKTSPSFDISKLNDHIKKVYGGAMPKSKYLKDKTFSVFLNDGKATVSLESIEFVKNGVFNESSIEIPNSAPTAITGE